MHFRALRRGRRRGGTAAEASWTVPNINDVARAKAVNLRMIFPHYFYLYAAARNKQRSVLYKNNFTRVNFK